MTITSTDKFTIFTAEKDFETFKSNFSEAFKNQIKSNIVIDLSNIEATEANIISLEEFAEIQLDNKQSFAIVVPSFDADAFDEELNVVPTITEAEDIIDMDEMTRDLGF